MKKQRFDLDAAIRSGVSLMTAANALAILVYQILGGAAWGQALDKLDPHVAAAAQLGHNFGGAMAGMYMILIWFVRGGDRWILLAAQWSLMATPWVSFLALVLSGGTLHARGQFPVVGYELAPDPHWLNYVSTPWNIAGVAMWCWIAWVLVRVIRTTDWSARRAGEAA